MNQIDESETILSEDTVGQDVIGNNIKLVPVVESIRYRKRAQSAEKRSEVLAEQLAEAQKRISEMSGQLSDMQVEQKLTRKLAAAGVVDMEAAMLIAKARAEGSDEPELDSIIEQLKKEKQYLFGGGPSGVVTAKRTSGAKDRMQNSQTTLERAAKKAATTGNRADLQEYLKLRRNFV